MCFLLCPNVWIIGLVFVSVPAVLSTPYVFSQVRLIDAGFLWTEPHSKRIKVKVTIQKEVRKK